MTRVVESVDVLCPRITFEDGAPVECGTEIAIEIEYECNVASRRTLLPNFCTHGDAPRILTWDEYEELVRRADAVCSAFEPQYDYAGPDRMDEV